MRVRVKLLHDVPEANNSVVNSKGAKFFLNLVNIFSKVNG